MRRAWGALGRTGLWLAVGLALGGASARAESAGVPETPLSREVVADSLRFVLPDTLHPADGVRDPVFAILAGLVTRGCYGTLTGERLETELRRIGTKSMLPYESVVRVNRTPVREDYTASVTVEFERPIDLPVPYSILGYHPGSFSASQFCEFREWQFPSLQFVETVGSGKEARTRTLEVQNVHLFALSSGEVWIDIDVLVDKMLGGAIDDTRVTTLVLCQHQGEWLGVATGYGRRGEGRSGVLSLRENKILFPTPDALKGLGRRMRGKAESLSKLWDEDEAAAPVNLERSAATDGQGVSPTR